HAAADSEDNRRAARRRWSSVLSRSGRQPPGDDAPRIHDAEGKGRRGSEDAGVRHESDPARRLESKVREAARGKLGGLVERLGAKPAIQSLSHERVIVELRVRAMNARDLLGLAGPEHFAVLEA